MTMAAVALVESNDGPSTTQQQERIVLERSVRPAGSESTLPERRLNLMMLGCEENHPYGPSEHTATLFLNLVCQALELLLQSSKEKRNDWTVSIAIYRVQLMDYPQSAQEWDQYDGLILPGSLSGAHEKKEWIEKLCRVIATEVHGRKTFGVCFGHQVYAHALQDGLATACPAGTQAGRRTVSLTPEAQALFDNNNKQTNLELLCTHGDHVDTLPSCAVRLGESAKVPIQAAAYFTSTEEKNRFLSKDTDRPRPVAITFQAHPEYAHRELGVEKTLDPIFQKHVERGQLSTRQVEEEQQDILENYETVERHSHQVMAEVGKALGWF